MHSIIIIKNHFILLILRLIKFIASYMLGLLLVVDYGSCNARESTVSAACNVREHAFMLNLHSL